MHILMIAPEPFFEPRGTPFSEFHRIRALTSLGHTVDLATYPFGRDVELRGLRIFRSFRPPFVTHVGIGPSWTKVPLNLLLTLTACRLALTGRYDAVHSHEEGGGIGVILAWLLRVPHLYDMHSSLPQQVTNFGYRKMPGLAWILGRLERLMIRGSRVVIVICADLETTVRQIRVDVPTVLIENAPGAGAGPTAGSGLLIRQALGVAPSTPVALYTGTFEHYQGLDLLYAAMARVKTRRPEARLVLVGGDAAQVSHARRQIDALGLTNEVILTGQRPAEEIPGYLDAATVLVSPRSTGTNTPLKIYQYLRSGRAIVATNLRTHTQVLSDDFAFLAAPTPEAFGDAILGAFEVPARADAIGARAREIAETRYSDEAYIAKTSLACGLLVGVDPAGTEETGRGTATPVLLPQTPRGTEPDHYSYTHYANRDVAEGFEALRFSGPIGQHLQQTQEALLLEVLAPLEGRRILDVGAGTGRAALALAAKGAIVHGVDASAEMLEVARERAAKAGLTIRFDVADAHALPVGDRSVDAAVCFRLLMHVIDWPTCVAELCRVSRHRVVIDFPAAASAAAVESAVRRRRQAAGAKVEAYRVLREADVRRVFAENGYRVVLVRRQFVLPIALHKAINRLSLSLGIERALSGVGLLRLLGSPVTMVAER